MSPMKKMASSIHSLPTELIERILVFLQPEYYEVDVGIDQRKYFSKESLALDPIPPSNDAIADVGNFRRTCRRYETAGRSLLFSRVGIRFSDSGLRRLEQLAQWEHLACLVERFSYLVPYFYDEKAHDFDGLSGELINDGMSATDIDQLRRKELDQRTICANNDDVRILKRAIACFTRLKFVQLLRVTAKEDRMLLSYLARHEEARRTLNLDWNIASSHASMAIITALLTSTNVPCSRFRLQMLSPDSAQNLRLRGPNSVSTLAERLEVLTLTFDDSGDLDEKIQELSAVFREVFSKAKNMRAVHVGFPGLPFHRPLTLPLETVFHDVRWDKLVAFGIQGWELEEVEIISLVRRHPQLRGLRLRDVHLKDDSLWRNILGFLRSDMHELQWVSLRGIGYTRYLNSQQFSQNVGTEIPDHSDLISLSSDDENEEDNEERRYEDDEEDQEYHSVAGPSARSESSFASDTHSHSDVESDAQSNAQSDDDEHGPAAHAVDFPLQLDSPITPASTPWCMGPCVNGGAGRLESTEDLEDDGLIVSPETRKYWERWVLRKGCCVEHG